MRPPHATGGAVDLTLTWWAEPLALGTDYDAFCPEAHLGSFESWAGPVRGLRRMLGAALLAEGFASYELEWWHWSHGDDVWAAAGGVPARYDVLPGGGGAGP